MLNFKLTIIILLSLITSTAFAGTILLMAIGNGAPGGGACSNSLDFTKSCNSQYITVVGGF